jgi:glycosyltransferase involved in cell wall biosynthesis
MCTYRRPTRLIRSVAEVFSQERIDDQVVVVVDDGSDDEGRTEAALVELKQEFGNRLTVIRQETNQGVAVARTTGVKAGIDTGAVALCFHDDDDLWLPDRLVAGFAPFADPAVAMTYGDQHQIDDSFLTTGEVTVVWSSRSRGYWGTIAEGMIRGRPYFPFQTAMFSAELCRALVPFLAVRESEDNEFALRALKTIKRNPKLRFARLPQLLAYHVSSPDSLSLTPENRAIRDDVHRAIFAQHLPRPVVNVMFELSRRVLRPAAIRMGRAQPLSR